MFEVYIDHLIITDFGPFFGKHEFDFTGIEGKNVILVGGKNGAGKTHLLRAIYLAIAGESGISDLKKAESGSDATKFDIKESLNRFAKAKGNDKSELSITLRLRDKTNSIGKKVTIIREIRHRSNSTPVFTAKVTGFENEKSYSDETDDSLIKSIIDNFLPRHLARFFFFDAERGQNIQLSDSDITEGISRVLGLFSYGELEDRLRKLSAELRSKNNVSKLETELSPIRVKIEENKANLKAFISDLDDKKGTLVDLESELHHIEDELQSLGAVDPAKIKEVQDKRKELDQTIGRLKEQLKISWEKGIPLFLLGNYRFELTNYLSSEERRREWENRKSAVEPRIPQVKKDVFENAPIEYRLEPRVYSFYEDRLQDALRRIFDPAPQGMSPTIFVVESNERSQTVRNVLGMSTKKVQNLVELCKDIERKSIEQKEIDLQLRSFQQDEETKKRIQQLYEERGAVINRIANLRKEIALVEANKNRVEKEIPELERRETNLENELQKSKKEKDISDLAGQYREAVAEIKKRAAIKLRDRISSIVGELWLDITDRGIEFQALEFNDRWECFVIKHNNEKLLWNSINTSAGQRQVRVLTFTEALRRLAHKTPPLVIDTPLGRLDKEVKQSVLERLYLKGHQTIIFSTNAEIDPKSELFEQIEQYIARVYTLNAEGDPESHSYRVRVSEDYFKRVL